MRFAQVAIRTLDKTTGEPCKGKTRPEVISRALTISPGSVYSLRQLKQDLDAIYSTGIFEDVNMVPSPSDEPGKARAPRSASEETPAMACESSAGQANAWNGLER